MPLKLLLALPRWFTSRLPARPFRHRFIHSGVLAISLTCGVALAQPALTTTNTETNSPATVATSKAAHAELKINGREVMVFRSAVGPYSAEQRAAAASALINHILKTQWKYSVEAQEESDYMRIRINGQVVFSIAPGDYAGLEGVTRESLVELTLRRLDLVIKESSEFRDPRHVALTILKLLLVTAAWLALIWILARNRRSVDSRLLRLTAQKADQIKSHTLRLVGLQNVAPLLRGGTAAVFWLIVGVSSFLWAEYLLRLFPKTRAFGEQLGNHFLGVLGGFGESLLGALPGLGVVFIIWLGARFAVTASKRYFNGIIQGRFNSGYFDETSAQVTLRLSILLIWIAAIIIAFPYIPGSQSPAFRGIGVLSGLMLSLGASSIITQWVNGLILVYNRTCQIGDYVKVGEFEGTLVNIGFSTSRLLTSRNEEVILPNSQLTGGSLINYSRLNESSGVIVPVSVSIGYNTPWRQVHAMLIQAASRTPRLKQEPQPSVFQSRLSDFYVEYQLRVALENPAERNAVLSQLHANIQDVFNEYGVQIMSPHYLADPPQPAVVPKDKWHTPPAGPSGS